MCGVPILRELGLRRGTLIADTYRIVRPLGAGGMGVVTLAHDERLDRDVAIKFVRPELFAHQNLRELFCIEARAMARVSHPNVLAVHAFGEHDGTPFFVMEYVDGPTAEQWLERSDGPPDIDEVLRILEQACRGVEAIHAASTVHRDLKPSNLLIDASLRVAVSDLGVARILAGAGGADPTCIVGSAAYMAPEAALGDDSKPELATRRDVYALGCIAYELLAGRPPFVAPTDMGVMAKHLLELPPPDLAASGTTCRPATTTCCSARSRRIRTSDGGALRRCAAPSSACAPATRFRRGSSSPTTTTTGARCSTMRSLRAFPTRRSTS